MNEFRAYLQELQMKDSTINSHVYNMLGFFAWLASIMHLKSTQVQYKDLLAYIKDLQQQKLNRATINLRMASISHYYDYLKHKGQIDHNPASTLRMKAAGTQVIGDPISFTDLGILYQQYEQLKKTVHVKPTTDIVHQRNIIMLGLLIWQGVHSGELQKMEIGDINLKEGKIYIPSTNRSNSRELPMSFIQLLPLTRYLQEIRPQLHPQGYELFPGRVHHILTAMKPQLQQINPLVRNALHIRASVILHWLKQHNIREVQYMAGHKYVSSTEKYALQDMESLTDQLAKYHPFG